MSILHLRAFVKIAKTLCMARSEAVRQSTNSGDALRECVVRILVEVVPNRLLIRNFVFHLLK